MTRPLLLLLTLCLLAGCDSASVIQAPDAPPVRVAVIVLENHETGDVLGSPRAPYLNSLAREYALVPHDHGLAHPSLPNYIGLVTGRTAGITSDCVPRRCPVSGPSLVDQLEAGGVSWRAYMESMPRPCFHFSGDELGRYAQRHNPFSYLTRVWRRPERCGKVVPLTSLSADLKSGLPRFAWITPNLCHDMHDCPISSGDAWLRRTVPPLLKGLGPNGVLVITFDEGRTSAECCGGAHGGQLATVLAGGGAPHGVELTRAVDHYSTLATVESLLGLPRLGHARTAPALTSLR